MLGGLFIAVTLFLPKGIVGTLGGLFAREAPRHSVRRPRRRTPNPAPIRGGGVAPMTEKARNSLLYLDGVTVSFDGFKALNELSLVIEPGEMRAIIGPNGAGKTTMMDVVTGKTKARRRRHLFRRHRRSHAPRRGGDRRRSASAASSRSRRSSRATRSRTISNWRSPAGAGPFQALLSQLHAARPPRRIDELLEHRSASTDRRNVQAAYLSHGQKQWLEIGMLLAQEPKLLLVDEPAAGMTDAETEATAELLKDIAREKSVIVVEHDMAFVRALGVKVTVLHEGSVISEGTIDHVSADPRVVEVYLGR